jgi:PAS domain S-box-containing protein
MSHLANLLHAQLDALLERWIAQVGASLAPDRVSTPELRDHLPAFLQQLIVTLRDPPRDSMISPVDGQSPVGREHGAQRFRVGFELESVVREYGLLLHLVLDLVESEETTVSSREVRRLNDLVTNAVAEATAEYARRLATTDVTEAVQARREAERTKAQLETTLFSMGDGVLATDAQGRVSLINPAAEGLTGWSAAEAIGQPVEAVLVLVDAVTRAPIPSPFAEVLRGKPARALGNEILLARRDGATLAFADSLAAIRDSRGAIVGAVLVFRDETETRRKDRELEAARREADIQREHLNNAFTQAPVAVGILHGADDVVVLANDGMCRIWGVTREAVIDRPLFDLLVDAKKQGFPELLAGVRRTGTPFVGREATVTLPRLGGGTEDFFINFVYQPLREADGSIVDILVVATDVTVEVKARRAAEAVSAEFEAMFNGMTDAVYFGDTTGVRRANGPGLELLGAATVEELRLRPAELSQRFSSRLASTGEPLPPERANFVRALAGESFREEYLIWHPLRKQDLRIRSVVSPVRIGGKITGAVVLNTDITEQHRALDAIRRSEENFRTLAEAIPQQVWTSTPDGALDFVNERVLTYFDSTREQVLGAGWQAVIHPDDLASCIQRWTHSLATGEKYEVELRLRRSDDTYRWHLGRALAVRDAAGEIVKWFGTNTDIDEANKVREELAKRTDFEQHLLGIVSHDLRNPLGAILLGATGLLELEDQSDWAMKIALRIRSSAERSVRMISDLLDFTQARLGGGIRLERRAADMHSLARTVLDELEATYPDRTLDLIHAGDTRGTWDPDRITQAVSNLVTNALKYSPPGTPVAVRAAGLDGHVEITIHNEGAPIPKERLGQIFEPLQRATDEIDLKTRSVGLGLYIVKAIVHAHGGTVSVVSTAEAGTTFTVRLPREPAAPRSR